MRVQAHRTVTHIANFDHELMLLHITDLHLFADCERELRGVNTERSFAAVLRAAQANHWPPGLIVLTGDLSQDEIAPTYERLARILQQLDVPVISLPGNHDEPRFLRRFLDDGRLRYCRPATVGNWRFIPLSSRVAGKVGGIIDDAQLESLRNELDNPVADNLLLFLHHHPLPTGSRWLDRIGLDNAQELLELVDASSVVRGVFWGHVHQEFETRRNGTIFASTPSTCAQFRRNSDDFAVDELPAAYRVLELSASGEIGTSVHWVDVTASGAWDS